MITSAVTDRIKFSPARRDQPRIVSQGMIEAFERQNPALAGISAHMVELGIWILDNEGD